MKKVIAILALCCVLSGALAEGKTISPTSTPTPLESSTHDFLDSLANTWDAFLGLANVAGGAITENVNAFIDQNFPEFRTWLDEVGKTINESVSPEMTQAWNTLVESAGQLGTHTQEEIQRAYEALEEYLKSTNASQKTREAVDGIAGAAGADTQK